MTADMPAPGPRMWLIEVWLGESWSGWEPIDSEPTTYGEALRLKWQLKAKGQDSRLRRVELGQGGAR